LLLFMFLGALYGAVTGVLPPHLEKSCFFDAYVYPFLLKWCCALCGSLTGLLIAVVWPISVIVLVITSIAQFANTFEIKMKDQ